MATQRTRPLNIEELRTQNFDAGCARFASLAREVLFQGKWKMLILCAMRRGPIRLGQLGRLIPGASKKMLTQNLRELEADGIIVRNDLSELVLHVEYSLNEETRQEVCDLLDHVVRWGGLYIACIERPRK